MISVTKAQNGKIDQKLIETLIPIKIQFLFIKEIEKCRIDDNKCLLKLSSFILKNYSKGKVREPLT